jgi:hypothetical protein
VEAVPSGVSGFPRSPLPHKTVREGGAGIDSCDLGFTQIPFSLCLVTLLLKFAASFSAASVFVQVAGLPFVFQWQFTVATHDGYGPGFPGDVSGNPSHCPAHVISL